MALLNFLKLRSEVFDFSLTTTDSNLISYRDNIFSSIKANLGTKKLTEKKEFLLIVLLNLRRNLQFDTQQNPHYIGILINKNYYSNINNRYKLPIQSYEVVRQVIQELINLQLIEFRKGYKDSNYSTGNSSKIRAIGNLKTQLSSVNHNIIKIHRPPEFIILRDLNKNNIGYQDTQYTIDIRNDILCYSSLRERTPISLKAIPVSLVKQSNQIYNYVQNYSPDDLKALASTGNVDINISPGYLVRIFNTSFSYGGRYYWGVETGMPSEIRSYFHFNNNSTVELDYSGSHIRMLYHIKGLRINNDPYSIPGYPVNPYREYFKYASLTMINASSEDSAIRSIMRETGGALVQNGYLQRKGLKESIIKLCDDFKKHHKRIATSLYSGIGLSLMKLDSEIANDIINHFTSQEIFIMCIHDSFIIEKQHEKELRSKMIKLYKDKIGSNPVVK